MNETKLGKIESAHYGICGYQECMLGLSLTISGDGWGVGADRAGGWAIERSERAKWTEEDRVRSLGENAIEIGKLLKQAKVQSVDKLKGTPVECVFEGNSLKSWRILTEVI